MRKVEYPKGTNYVQDYLTIFQNNIVDMRNKWVALQQAYPTELGHLPTKVDDILKADYSELVKWYIQFKNLPYVTRGALNIEFGNIFEYEKWSAAIAEYFMDSKRGYKISSCHYCDMAYINVYEVDPEADGLYILNNSPADELKVRLKTRSDISVAEVMKHQYKSKDEFEKVAARLRWKTGKFDRMFSPNDKYKRHFDLDHVLPKSEFELVGLSLFNFVPSCQICNQNLKGTKVLGKRGVPKEKLSPTSPLFDFDNKVEFHVIPKPGVKPGRLRPTLHPQDYDLQLDAIDPDYEDFIQLFKLQERYQFHKKVALHWQEMKSKYSDARILMMEASLKHRSFSFKRIKSDIFQSDLYKKGYMSFKKLRDDMLK
jgi:hypothetical protein